MPAVRRSDDDPFALLAAAAPLISCRQAEQVARDHFGVTATARPLSAERDCNFHLTGGDRVEYVLKIDHPQQDARVTDMQTRALRHIAVAQADLPVPRVCRACAGGWAGTVDLGDGRRSTARLLSYLPGVPMSQVDSTPGLRRQLGVHLAALDRALYGFSHPAQDHCLLWDLKHAALLEPLASRLPTGAQRRIALDHLDRFGRAIRPALEPLRRQVIYNDLNPSNVLVDPADPGRITGMIDFGDMVRSALIVDVAVAATYQLRHTSNPFEAAAQLVGAYHRRQPLETGEIGLLFDLIVTRLIVAVLISTWRQALFPANAPYIMRNTRSNWQMLQRIQAMRREDVGQRLQAACAADR